MLTDNVVLKPRDLSPYISFTVFVQPTQKASVASICEAIRKSISDNDARDLITDEIRPTKPEPAGDIALVLAFSRTAPPSWGRMGNSSGTINGQNREYHLVSVLVLQELVAIYSSDSWVVDTLLRKQRKNELAGVGLLDREALEEALAQGDVATLWMGQGPATRGVRRPRAKTIYGNQLESTIDPIGDQLHTLSGVRSTADEGLLGPGRAGVVGTNFKNSSFWVRPAKTWREFVEVTFEVLASIKAVIDDGNGRLRFTTFARFVDELEEAETGYDLAFLNLTGARSSLPTQDEVDDHEWLVQTVVDVRPTGARTVRVQLVDTEKAEISILPTTQRGSISFDVTHLSGDQTISTKFKRLFEESKPVLYYASGHSVSGDGIVSESYRDIPFGAWSFHDFAEYDIGKEKPGAGRKSDLKNSGQASDLSLFGWVARNRTTGWLYCDDRQDENADFIHLSADQEKLEIWHVKAVKSGNTRRISNEIYEKICAQAIKNLAILTPSRLCAELAQLEQAKRGPLWKSGEPSQDFDGFLKALMSPAPSLEVIACILLPHVTRSHLEAARSDPSSVDAQRLRRLDDLLISTNNAMSQRASRLIVFSAFRP